MIATVIINVIINVIANVIAILIIRITRQTTFEGSVNEFHTRPLKSPIGKTVAAMKRIDASRR
ncbi:MAG: hypothetical protein HOM52_11215 [Rhodospirillaceae bacterium]|nr:hypothetical protein [Rhodospirillaceae bacterium]MBT4426495.1 hypothetical protein [Rhodospirillaceae bacterium]MBT5039070.1 hypothetical protein [Rhodospirillaceae bacterium]MBT5676167.1 hypothetical protein [Rhodospirillaceae bacterium]MBT6827970.1 hypothetical protein [Rhodospirillaceae bacterium]